MEVYDGIELPLKLWLGTWFKWDMQGLEKLEGGAKIVACNHPSYIDPFAIGYAFNKAGRNPRFLAKRQLFKNPVLGTLLRAMNQIPVSRGTTEAATSLSHAEQALSRGECVVVFAESTISPTVELLPLKTGAARLSLASGVPITPMAVWGGHQFWTKGGKRDLIPGKLIKVRVGDDVSRAGSVDNPGDVKDLTSQLADRLGALVRQAAGENI